MHAPTADGDTVVFVREAESRWQPTAADLAAFAGRYRNDEIESTYTLSVVNGTLQLHLRPGVNGPLKPTYRDAFEDDGDSIWFTRDKKGRVTAMHFGSARAWDLVSVRLP